MDAGGGNGNIQSRKEYDMALRISGKQMEIGDSFRSRIEERIGDSVSKYFDGGFAGQVIVKKEGSRILADCKVSLDTGTSFHAAGEAQDPHLAFEAAAERLDKRLRRYKRRLKSHSFAANEAAAMAEAAYRVVPDAGENDIEETDGGEVDGNAWAPAIVRESPSSLVEMSVAAAAVALDAKDDPFFIFRNVSNGLVNVVYHRPDGNVGWIDPAARVA